MTNAELIALFNPNNAANIGAQDLETMRALTDDQIDVLADAFPNVPTRRAYLILFDQNLPDNKQLYQLSTWQNLRNVRKYSNRKNLIAFTFKSIFDRKAGAAAGQTTMHKTTGAAKRVAVDLTAEQAKKELEDALGKKEGPGSIQQQTITTGQNKAGVGSQKNQPPKTTIKTALKGKGKSNVVKPDPDPNASPDVNESIPDDQQFGRGE